jgi:outer membrane protein assembly factor BamB
MKKASTKINNRKMFAQSISKTVWSLLAFMSALILSPSLFSAPPIDSATLLLADESISLWKINPETAAAEPVWNKTDVVTSLGPVASQNNLLIGSSTGLYALNPNDGRVVWQVRGEDLIYTPAVENETAFAASRDGKLRAINNHDGTLLWTRTFPGWIYTPALSRGMLITGGSASQLWGIDQHSGETVWQYNLPGELVSAPTTQGADTVIAATFSSDLIALRASTGDLMWQRQLSSAATDITANDEIIFSSGYDGIVHANDARTGAALWQRDTQGDRRQRLQLTESALLVINDEGLQSLSLHNGDLLVRQDIPGEPIGVIQKAREKYWIFFRQHGHPQPIRLSL